jgi:hypothetical protein
MRHRFRALAVAAAASVMAAVGVSAPVAAAECVTKAEAKAVRDGMTQYQVYRLTGMWGRIAHDSWFGSYHSVTRKYRPCFDGGVYVYFANDPPHPRVRVINKSWYWTN